MQGSNDVPFAGSLHRKSSHTTYGRKGRASLAAKDGHGAGSRASSQGPQAESGSDNFDSRKHQPPSKPASELDRDGAFKPKSSGTAETASLGAIGVKRKGTGEETLLGDKSQASGFSSGKFPLSPRMTQHWIRALLSPRTREQTAAYHSGCTEFFVFQTNGGESIFVCHVTFVRSLRITIRSVRR